MNRNERLAVKLGSLAGGLLALALTGCTNYEQGPRDRGAYYGPSGQADGLYAEIRTESDFYEPLSPYGRWEVVGSYGRCWIPAGVDAGWSPYANGYWQHSDAGWYWASDEPWGWATYHYGRWDSSPQFGWYWVPQTQWAPAWVSWREGGGYVGWAPLGPSGRAVVTVGTRGGTSGGYVFVEERRFLDPVRPTTVIVNNTIVTRTVINNGPGAAVIERASGRTMPAVPVRQLRSREEAKVGARHAAPASAGARAVQTPVSRQAEETPPAPVHRQVEQPAVAVAHPQTPVSRQVEKAPPAPVHRQVEQPAVMATKPETPVSHQAEETPPAPVHRQVEQPGVTAAKPETPVSRQVEKASPAPMHRQVEKPAVAVAQPRAPVTHQAEKAPSAREVRPAVKPAEPMAEPRAPAAGNDVRRTDGPGRPANLDETKRASQQDARVKESQNRPSGVAVAEAKPATRPAVTRKPTEPKAGKDDEDKAPR